MITVCVRYSPTFPTERYYYTGYNYDVTQKSSREPETGEDFYMGKSVPADQILIFPSRWSDGTLAR